MMKKVLFLLMGLLVFVLAACSGGGTTKPATENEDTKEVTAEGSGETASADIDWPKETIRFIVPFNAGGGTDLAARALQPYLEDELGVSVVVENVTGGGGWIGWGELANAKPDGYTLGYMVFPNIFTGYLNPTAGRTETLDSYEFLISHHEDSGLIAVRGDDDRFNTIEEFIKYAQENELASSSGGVGSSPHFAGVQLNDQLDTKLRFVHGNGGAEAITQLLGGHIDVAIIDYPASKELIKSGEIKVLATLGNDQNPNLPDVPSVNEAMGSNVAKLLSRGIAGPKGMDPAIVEKLTTAIENAMNNPEHKAKIEEMGMKIDGMNGEEYLQSLQEQEAAMKGVIDLFGW
ncbi:hypothetical protein EBB45_00200 [Lysinibacillus composti]|uniref:Tripartite tricarboxylate transporter substrate binding protein n=2 Tax=Lysinibacillus composti TaxID=720633 RepID=A0A3N9UJ50_9BACI|nr:hypothetical protein EBB45_00200 [Lysinibacillus composti]